MTPAPSNTLLGMAYPKWGNFGVSPPAPPPPGQVTPLQATGHGGLLGGGGQTR